MTIATLKDGTDISHTDAAKALQERIGEYTYRQQSIHYVCHGGDPMTSSKIRVKVGCKQRIKALETTLLCLIQIEAAALNNEPTPLECKKRVRRSISHLFGALRKEGKKHE